ncbi:hypothetical protein GCM10009785_14420 [Brooklawnia cerclae]|uniref:FmdB family regulatory protein n=1 Tax=Brooklawnia cerclae TaxID=349934 RepID=A0ABX0SHW7_9ACTN|nr:FmdB family zinc ribbon protein [Brooklawnia cerclae]NIH57988.1 putative FmdB family regulatory protein [Brooklawnia cerclae]
MPTYQYRCQTCHNELEAFQKFSDDPLTICPECGGPLRKVFNSVGIVFKGSGFYATDSRKSSTAADLTAKTTHSSESGASSSSTSSTSSDSSGSASSSGKDAA